MLLLIAPIEIEANLESPDGISDDRLDKMAAIKCNYNSEQKYEISRMYVSKPGWYHTIIAPVITQNQITEQNNEEAMQLCEPTMDSQHLPTNTQEAMQNCMYSSNTSNLQANCDVQGSNNECSNNIIHSQSQLTNGSINTNNSHINGTVKSHVTEVSPDGKHVSISITITLSDT